MNFLEIFKVSDHIIFIEEVSIEVEFSSIQDLRNLISWVILTINTSDAFSHNSSYGALKAVCHRRNIQKCRSV